MLGNVSIPKAIRRLVTRRTGMVAAVGAVLAVGLDRVVGPGLLSFAAYQSSSVTVLPTATWTPTSLTVREGEFYRLTATGSCTDESGQACGPAGLPSALVDQQDILGGRLSTTPTASTDVTKAVFDEAYPRRMLVGRVKDSRFTIPVGASLTFVAPWTGELSFRVNEEPDSQEKLAGSFRVALTRVTHPSLVDKDGKTTISAPVCSPKYLLFEPAGVRWRYLNHMSATEEPVYPTLINGIAWWPLPDKPNVEGWRELTQTSRSLILQTSAFSWAAGSGPTKVQPFVVTSPTNPAGDSVTIEGPAPDVPALKFRNPEGGTGVIRCTVSIPSSP
jgi:hypothetical protein